MKRYWHMWFGALFMKQTTFDAMSEERYAFAHGFTFIVIVGALAGLARIVGAFLQYTFSPPVDQIKNTVLLHLERMPWYLQLANPELASPARGGFAQQFSTGYEQWWRTFGDFVVPNPYSFATLSSVVTLPLYFALTWLFYGAVVHWLARRFGSEGTLGFGLGTLALATAPQIVSALTFLPQFEIGGGLVALWTMLLNYIAVRTNYRLSAGRAFFVTFLPLVVFALILIILVVIGIALLPRAGGRL